MIEIADVFRRFAADYLDAHGAAMPPSHRRAIADILDCRTAALGGQVWRCDECGVETFSYHSCGNRSCPKCHTAQTREWLEHRQAEMLPVPYFHITVTVPAELRAPLRAHQRDGYAVLMQATAAAIIEIARDPRFVGGTVAVLAAAGKRATIDEIAARYQKETGREATIFAGSSPGARPFGIHALELRP